MQKAWDDHWFIVIHGKSDIGSHELVEQVPNHDEQKLKSLIYKKIDVE